MSFDIRYSTLDKSFFVTRGIDLFWSISGVNPLLLFLNDKNEEKYIFETVKFIQSILYFSVYKTVFSKKIVFNMALYGGVGHSFTQKKTHYFQLTVGPIETYFREGIAQAMSFFVKCLDENNFSLKCINKGKCRIALKMNFELRFKILETTYFGFYLFGFFNGGNLYVPFDNTWYELLQDNGSFLSKFNPLKFSAVGVGIKLNIPIIGVLGIHCGADVNTKEFSFGLTFRQDFELVF